MAMDKRGHCWSCPGPGAGRLARISCGAGYRAGMPTALKQKAQSRTKSILSHYGSATTDQALSVMKEGATLQVQGKTSSLTPAHLPEGERQVRALHLHAGQLLVVLGRSIHTDSGM